MFKNLTCRSHVFQNCKYFAKVQKCNKSTDNDVVVIGAGPGGYVAAIKAAQLGLKTVCVEKNSTLGGTCLNVGCIPSKAVLHASHEYYKVKNGHLSKLGISTSDLNLDVSKMMNNKDNIVSSLTGGIEMLFKKNKVRWAKGHGTIIDKNTVSVLNEKEQVVEEIKTKNIILASGSHVSSFPGIEINEKTILSSTGALSLDKVPERMVVIGAGVIGLELGSVWSRLGSKVTCIEYLDTIGGIGIDDEVSKGLESILKKQGIKFLKSHKVEGVEDDGHVVVNAQDLKKQTSQQIECDVVLVCTGRSPYTAGLGLERINAAKDDRGRIVVNDTYQTSQENVFAIGDCIKGPMLAHKAEDEGIVCAEFIAKGVKLHLNYNAVPSVLYTHPEVAWVGKNEQELIAEKIPYKVGKFPMIASGRAKTMGESEGFVKIMVHKETDRVLGMSIIASCAGELINEAALCIEYGASSEDIARVCHAHPTIAETIREAALCAYSGKAIHM